MRGLGLRAGACGARGRAMRGVGDGTVSRDARCCAMKDLGDARGRAMHQGVVQRGVGAMHGLVQCTRVVQFTALCNEGTGAMHGVTRCTVFCNEPQRCATHGLVQ